MFDKLNFSKIPETWEHFLPVGNGRIGAMVKTHPCNEIIQLNEENIWSGGPQDRVNPDSISNINNIRELVKNGKVIEAQGLGFEALSATTPNERVYQTAGEFKIDFFDEENTGLECGWPLQHKCDKESIESYKSDLDLAQACTTVTYINAHGIRFSRRVWISAVDDMLFMHVTASKKGQINFCGHLDRGIWCDSVYSENGFIFLEDSHGIPFCDGVGAVSEGGSVFTRGANLCGLFCDEVLFFIDIRTWKLNKKKISRKEYDKSVLKNTWTGECKSNLLKMREFIVSHGVNVAAEDLFGWHLVEYKSYWDRMELCIGEKEVLKQVQDSKIKVNTPDLLKTASNDNTLLVNLYTNFSRYLLISGSRTPGILPATLQGLWNCYMDPPWGSKYTININAQMNYWPVNMTGLCECELPLFELLERGYENGCDVAKRMYGCRGYVLHHNTDFWGDAAPVDNWLPGTYWVLGAAWLSTHIWEHYEYTMDKKFLERYYYLIHEACRFFVDFLIPCDLIAADGNPYLVICPSLSPENSYVTKTGQIGAFCEGSEMDNMILEHLFTSCLKAHKVLGKKCYNNRRKAYKTDEFGQFEYVLNHLKKSELNSDGSLMEWNTEVTEVEPGHRHISHLYGLYPGHTITVEKTPELAKACKKTLEKRLSNGGGHTGWSQAWIINFYVQLGMGNEALDSVTKILSNSTLPNLLDNHPPFQIDGNFGSLAAIIRMLVQSEYKDDKSVIIKLLPSLPDEKQWSSGSVKGICTKGNLLLDFEWSDGKITDYKIYKKVDSLDRCNVELYEGGSDKKRTQKNNFTLLKKFVV